MNLKSGIRVTSLSLLLSICFAAQGSAQGASDPLQSQQQPNQEPPKPQEEPKCISSDTKMQSKGGAAVFVVELQNSCEKRLRCVVNAYVVGARGPDKGQKTMILAPKSKGAASRQVWAMKIKEAMGSATMSHKCTEL